MNWGRNIKYLFLLPYCFLRKSYTYFFFLGGPGSGRGTQCEKICLKHSDFVHLSSGDLMKNEVMSGSSRGGKLYALMSAGNPVPDEIVTDIIGEAMVKKAGGVKVFDW